MRQLDLLWIDLTRSLTEAELPSGISDYCRIQSAMSPVELNAVLSDSIPDVLCFDFDYPDRSGLRLLLDTKRQNPSLPIIMLTLQHSEALAIWAFRSKIWDYLVKPVPRAEVDRCLRTLLSIQNIGKKQRARVPAVHGSGLPEEVSAGNHHQVKSLAPAVYYVERYYRGKVSVEDAAKCCGMSPFRFSRAFKSAFGKTFLDYLVNYRLKEACRLLANPAVTVTDVAYAVGFNDPSYFARIFKQRFGTSPSVVIGTGEVPVPIGVGEI